MAKITKIYDDAARTTQVYPQTHEKAVVDNNGTTAETKFQMITDLVNQKQMEVGAVPSDLAPTPNSTNWVLSGGVSKAIQDVDGQFYTGVEELDFVGNTRTLEYWIGVSGNWNATDDTFPYYCRILQIDKNSRYRITAESETLAQFALLPNNTPVVGQQATDWGTPKLIEAGSSVVVDSGDYGYLYIRWSNSGTIIHYPNKIEQFISIYDEIDASFYPYPELVDFLGQTSTLAYWIGSSGNWNAKSNTYPYYCRILAVDTNRAYKITARTTRSVQYALLPNNTPVVGQQATDWNNGILKTIETGGNSLVNTGGYGYLYIRWDDSNFDYPEKIEEYVSVKDAFETIFPEATKRLDMEYGFIWASGDMLGYNSSTISNNQNYRYWRSCGMVKIKGGSYYSIGTNVNASYIRFYWYDEKRIFLTETTVTTLSLGQDGLYHVGAVGIGHYLRICISYETEYVPQAYISGMLEGGLGHKLSGVAPSGSVVNFIVSTYYQTLNSDIEETATIQDVGYKLINRGLLQLPTNYDPDGEPSRLVIYCHGADGFQNWDNNTNTWDVDHIDPTLWVNSGYAVMDMDDLTRATYLQDQDIPTLLTQNCYKEGYEHVLRNYNIKKDGVILCGRSLGGQRVMMLLKSQLPILCCCLVAPSCGFSRYWNMANRRRITTIYNNFPTTIDIDGVATDINWGATDAISDVEWTAMQAYYKMVLNTHGILKLLCINKDEFFATHTVGGASVSLRNNPEIWDREIFTNWVGKTDIPVKVWYAEDDDTLPDPTRNQDLLVAIVGNGGGICEYHVMATGGHYPERDGATVTYTNKYGVTFEDVSLVYAEMLQFIRRYE